MDENTFWLRVTYSTTIGVVLVIASFAGCTVNTNNRIAEAIKDGANPIMASCALSVNVRHGECAVLGAIEKAK